MATSEEHSFRNCGNKENNVCDIISENIISESGEGSGSQNTVSTNVLDTTKATAETGVNKESIAKQSKVDKDNVVLKSKVTKEAHFKAVNDSSELYSVAESETESDIKLIDTGYISNENGDVDNMLMNMGNALVGHEQSVINGTKAMIYDTSDIFAIHRTPHLHKLEKKHSSGDLHSRLKTRKLLGVGETDDGDVHRSKLSQILGHSDQLYIRLPGGLRIWQIILSIIFTVLAIWTLLFPNNFIKTIYEMDGSTFTFAVHLYACSLICISVMYWSTVQAADRDVIRMVLLSSVVFFSMHTCVLLSCWLSSSNPTSFTVVVMLVAQLIIIAISSYFYWITNKDCKTKDTRYFQ